MCDRLNTFAPEAPNPGLGMWKCWNLKRACTKPELRLHEVLSVPTDQQSTHMGQMGTKDSDKSVSLPSTDLYQSFLPVFPLADNGNFRARAKGIKFSGYRFSLTVSLINPWERIFWVLSGTFVLWLFRLKLYVISTGCSFFRAQSQRGKNPHKSHQKQITDTGKKSP